ncbi:hypothetical protein OE88DRAFT_1666065 [Heliocybe sulcata]|uniref:Uncharacterized protein n=1 Tax=Heliocybe sulcata TaxID=5364 RepID=A0A5C3MR09_9AGAM|nr:hypothetical protein OE88DRAFT_1666065 [Heliocybe sulcata]
MWIVALWLARPGACSYFALDRYYRTMDHTDVLADTVPPRYAIESDEEEDEENPLLSSPSCPNRVADVKIDGPYDSGKPLLLATGHAGQYWSRGVQLGEPKATVVLNGTEVAYIFASTWANATIVVSEATIRIPMWAVYSYAKALIQLLKPSSMVVLDTYSASQYIDADPIAVSDAPIRYLSTHSAYPSTFNLVLSPFSPPNVLQSTSAAFILASLTCFSLSQSILSTLVLLPSPYSPLPPNSQLTSLGLTQKIEWPMDTMLKACEALLGCLGIGQMKEEWGHGNNKKVEWLAVRRDGQLPDYGMYI